LAPTCRLFAPARTSALLLLLLLLLRPGRGAYGSVYKALDRSSGQTVAVKVISTTDSDEDDLTRIHKEVTAAHFAA
jgi:serine/threonine protein kinase